jgi:hypothetical protein
MPLVTPKLVVLDSATLGNASRDYWSREQPLRVKARRFLAELTERGVYVAITLTHVSELLRYHDEHVVRDRLQFLRAIPLIASLRPYNRRGFPGGLLDLLLRELHAVVHADKRDWPVIVEHVRADLWKTGSGSDIVVDDDRMWLELRQEFQRQHHDELLIASIRRSDPGQTNNLTVRESERLPRRSKEERTAFMPRFAAAMREQLERHGDRRLESERATIAFLKSVMRDMQLFEQMGGDPIQRLLEHHDVPKDLVNLDMTAAEIGDLAVYIKQLKLLSSGLWPPIRVTVRDVPLNSLPSYVLEHKLAAIQRQATRVSGSDVGDGHIAPLTLYADGVEVDKRTCEFLSQVQRANGGLAKLMQPFFRSPDYAEIPDRVAPTR